MPMAATPEPGPQPARPRHRRRRVRPRPRLLVAAAIGIIAAVAPPEIRNPSLRAVIGWDIGAALFLALLLTMMAGATPAVMRRRALEEDEARWAFLALMAGAAFFSLFAILGIMPEAKKAGGWEMAGLSMLGAVTILLSWLLAHGTFAVHYAHEYFYEIEHREAPGLEFPGVEDFRVRDRDDRASLRRAGANAALAAHGAGARHRVVSVQRRDPRAVDQPPGRLFLNSPPAANKPPPAPLTWRFPPPLAGEGFWGVGFAQCAISTGTVMWRKMPRLTPPSTNSRSREWP